MSQLAHPIPLSPLRGFRAWLSRLRDKVIRAGAAEFKANARAASVVDQPVIVPLGSRTRSVNTDHVTGSDRLMKPVRDGLGQVPPLPHLVRELLSELSDPASSSRSVARIASSDPALAASLIRTVNAASYGLCRKVTSVTEAVSYLGYTVVRSLLVRMRLELVLPSRNTGGYDAEDLWIHSMAVSHAADVLASRVTGVDRGFVATLGLLHDIGKLAINNQFPESAARLHARDASLAGQTFLERERLLLGADHGEIGAILAKHWRLPNDLIEAIRWHHAPQSMPSTIANEVRRATAIVHVANQLAKYCYVYGEDVEIDILEPAMLMELGLPASVRALLGRPVKQAISRAIFFAEESSTRPIKAIRRFLRLSQPAEAEKILSSPGGITPSRVLELSERELAAIAINEWPRPGAKAVTRRINCTEALFCNVTSCNGIRTLVEQLLEHLESMPIETTQSQPVRFVVRRLLSHLTSIASSPALIHVGIQSGGDQLRLLVSSDVLAVPRRFGGKIDPVQTRALMDREWANVLNLGWFDEVATGLDGGCIQFTKQLQS